MSDREANNSQARDESATQEFDNTYDFYLSFSDTIISYCHALHPLVRENDS